MFSNVRYKSTVDNNKRNQNKQHVLRCFICSCFALKLRHPPAQYSQQFAAYKIHETYIDSKLIKAHFDGLAIHSVCKSGLCSTRTIGIVG